MLGIDPGSASGALAVIDTISGAFVVADIPIVGKGRINSQGLATLITANICGRPDHCFLESARTMPKQGISSSGRYMHAAGKIEAVVEMLEIPLTLVEPAVWKKAMNLRGKDKEAARLRAIQLFPKAGGALARKRDHGRAESLLIARFGQQILLAPLRDAPAAPLLVSSRQSAPRQVSSRLPRHPVP